MFLLPAYLFWRQHFTFYANNRIVHIIICDWACENQACGHKLHSVTLKVISQYWNRVFLFCNLHNEFLIIAENFIAIACWDKELWIQKDWKNHVPTCPVFACPVTYKLHVHLAIKILVVDSIWTLFTQKKGCIQSLDWTGGLDSGFFLKVHNWMAPTGC